MVCEKCKAVYGAAILDDIGRFIGFAEVKIELCPKHAMLERLVAALREEIRFKSLSHFDPSREAASKLLKEYDQLEGK